MIASDIRLNRLKLRLCSAPINDVAGAAAREMELFRAKVRPNMRVAVTVGSRGIANIAAIVHTVIERLKDFGAEPFIIPAMGSHGGATAEGQRGMLAAYGVTAETMDVPIYSSMETVQIATISCEGEADFPVYMDKFAYNADAIFDLGRVKPHTDFHGEHESGIVKMLCIGLGKHSQALATHNRLSHGLRTYIPIVAKTVIATGKVLGALAIVEDGYDQTSILRAALPEDILAVDAELLIRARSMMPKIPFENLHVMLVDRLGKNISGTGMDINIIGRMGILGEADSPPFTNVLCAFDLTHESHGNALGIGLADIIPRSLYNKVDWQATYENVKTTNLLRRGLTPLIMESGRDVVDAALRTCGYITPQTLKLLRIRDTLHLDEIFVSDALLEEAAANPAVEIAERGLPLCFDAADFLELL